MGRRGNNPSRGRRTQARAALRSHADRVPMATYEDDWKLRRCVHCGQMGDDCHCPVDDPPGEADG